jgi:signal transduction histidine kinase
MKQYSYKLSSFENLNEILQSDEILSFAKFQSQLVQIYSAKNDSEWYLSIGNAIKELLPSAVIVGASSVGEILEGEILTNSTVVLFSFFESSSVNMFSYKCKPEDEKVIGCNLINDIKSINNDIKGLLLLSTPISNDSGLLFNTLTSENLDYPIFGGGAGDYANARNTSVYNGSQCFKQGVVVVVFSGNHLFIELVTSLGWLPLSKEMTITEVGEMSVKTLDDKPAFSVYEKYLGIKADKNFFQNSLEFPFLIIRNGQMIARTPFFVDQENGAIQLVGDVQVGEKVRIGYGDPQTIMTESLGLQKRMKDFKPEAIFLYSCICRRFLMQQDVDFETLPFNRIAPTAGFYTFGEFYGNNTFCALLNSSLVVVGFREGENDKPIEYKDSILNEIVRQYSDPYANKHSRILSRLLYFINVTTKELEEQNQLLKSLNEQKNEFIGIAAHDLRSPTGIILSFSELLENKIDDKYKGYMEIISQTSSTMLQLINDLLDISKIESGKLDLKRKPIEYIGFVAQNIKLNEYLAQNKRIQIVGDFEMQTQILVIDKGKIEQVLNNLIGNAIKYSHPDSTITVKVFIENDQIVTQIIDQGQGIPEDEIQDIFYPFKKTSVTPTSGEASHGLGLAIVKKIIEGHNGQIGVLSEHGKGSTFYFMLPFA